MITYRNARMGHPLQADEVQDVAQDTVVVVVRRLHEYEPRAPIESWILRICCLQMRDAIRAKWRRSNRSSQLVVEPEDPGSANQSQLADFAAAEVMLNRVGGIEARVIRLKHLESLTFEELSARLDLPANTAKTYYYRGLARLRAMLEESEEELCT